MAEDRFRVALSGDFRLADGSPAYRDFDLTPLTSDPRIEVAHVEPVGGAIPAAALEDADALILLVPRFTASSLPKGNRLAIVARFGVGYDNVDLEACRQAGIAAVITPDGVRRPVAVSILCFTLALAGNLMMKDRLARQGPQGWAQRSHAMGRGLTGRVFGQLGLGNIGAEVIRLARPLDLRFIAHDPYADPALARELGVELVGLEELFTRSDFVSVSVPLSEATRGLVDARLLSLMKPTSFLINTARGPVVDQKALFEVLKERRIAGAGLDVFEVEPTPEGEPLLALDNVIATPHSLCWTDECFAGIGRADVEACLAVMRGEVPRGLVDPSIAGNPTFQAKLEACRRRFAG
jgi:phosphoglycerate dehydrogenase-like enzyme